MTNRTKWGLLVGLLLMWATLIVLRLMTTPEPQRVPLKFKSGQMLAGEPVSRAGSLPVVRRPVQARLSDLTRRGSFKPPKNIFVPLESLADSGKVRRGTKPNPGGLGPQTEGERNPGQPGIVVGPSPPTPEELAAAQARLQQELAAQQARQQKENALQQARQQMAQYRFLGYLSQGGDQRAFLQKGRDLFIVRTGETVEGRIHVMAIGSTTVKLLDTPTSQETTLLLTREDGAVP